MSPTPESNEKMIKQNRMMINKLMKGGMESRDYGKRPDGTYGPSIVKPGKSKPGSGMKPTTKPIKGVPTPSWAK